MVWQGLFFAFSLNFLVHVSAQLYYSIPEELKQGSAIGNIARDLGLKPKELTTRNFHIITRGNIPYFNVNLDSGDLYITDKIDREVICGMKPSCLISFEAVIENPLHLYTIKVEIQDDNDNSPNFLKDRFDIVISESSLPGVHLALGHAQDPDLGTNSVQNYKISDNEFFTLGEKIIEGIKYPDLILEQALDREKQSMYEFILFALDGGQPSKTGTAIINISVHDVNDNFPKFKEDHYHVTLKEDVPVGFMVVHLDAVDDDDGSNAQITYSFENVPENVQQIFAVDPINGSIIVTGSLDYEITDEYKLTVEAKDGGGLVAHCKVLIRIVDVNDNTPEITVTSFSNAIPENSPPGTAVALINVHDLDTGENGEIYCHILQHLPFQLIFSPPNYYKIETTSRLDREHISGYNITIYAEDKGAPQLTSNKTIQLAILDVNDNPPVFEKQSNTIYISENNQPGTSVYKLLSSDPDLNENGKITYTILSSNVEDIPVSSYISINSVSGILYAQRSFDYEQLREFQFQVMAKDGGSPSLSSNVTVKICITDKNDNAPRILYPSPDTEESALFEFIPHFAVKGYLVTKVIAVDGDSGHNAWLSYHLLQVPDPSLFIINQQTGEISIGRDLPDLESLRQKLLVLVKDNGVPSLSSTVTIHFVIAEDIQQAVPEIKRQPPSPDVSSNMTFYLVISIAFISILFIVTVIGIVISKYRKPYTPTTFGAYNRNVYPQFTLGCPSEISDTSLPFPFSYDVCVTLDSKQNEIAYLKPVQNVPTDNLIDTGDSVSQMPNEDSQSTNVTQVRSMW